MMFNQLKTASSKAIIHLFSNSVIQVFVAFITNIILLRSISPEIFGSFTILVALIGFVFSILSLRLGIQVIRAGSNEYDEHFKSEMNSVFFLEVLMILICSVSVLLLTNYFQFWALIVLLAILTQHFVDYMKCFFERTMNYKVLAKVETYSRLLGHGFAITAIYLYPNKGFEILILRELISALCLLIGLRLIDGLVKFHIALPSIKTVFKTIKKIKNVWFEGVLEQSFSRLTLIGVSYISNPSGVGIFSQTLRLSQLLDQFIAPIYTRFSMNWYSREANLKRRLIAMYVLALSLLTINSVMVIFLYYFIEPIILFLYGEQWVKVADAMFYMFGLIIFRAPFEALKVYCYSQNILRVIFLVRSIQFFILGAAVFGNFEFFGQGINPVSIALSLSFGLGFGMIMILIPIVELQKKSI